MGKNKKEKLAKFVPEEIEQTPQVIPKSDTLILFVMRVVPILFIIFFSLVILPFYINAEEKGKYWGDTAGKAAGAALGSLDGITRGLEEGYEEGQRQGVSAEDTNVRIANEMTAIGKLDVLVAQDQFVDDFRQGNDYKALFVYKANARFSVNLEEASVSLDGTDLQISIPTPECEVEIDADESEKLAEWQKHFWSGSTEAGYIGYLNSMKQIKKRAVTELSNYDVLLEQAKVSARKQVGILVSAVTGDRFHIEVVFEGER